MEHKIYNPAGQPKEWLIQHFVVRTNVFEKIFKDIKTNPMRYPAQHYLIQGQRGMGKTTLLLRLKYEVENTPELNKWLIPVFFNEEVYDLTSLSNLWEKLLKYIDEIWNTGGIYYKKTDAFVGDKDYEKKCFELLISTLQEKKNKIIIFFDNFGQLFLDNLKEKEHHRLREVLMNCNDIRIIGASAIVLQDLHDYSKPFFEFFKIINLEGLNKDETLQLISKLQENSEIKIDLKKNKAKIETLAILTSGVIRTIMLIYEVVLNDQDGSALRDLEIILDRITPLYKHRIDDLPVQQRKIMDVIAKSWDAISTKEIAQNIREDGQPMATKLISAQLQQLEKNNIVDKKQTNTKNHLYQLRERFFNIWYLMRNGDRMDKCRVIWLTKFLETWYTDEKEFDSFIKDHIEHLKSGKYNPQSALIISEALVYSKKLNVLSLDILLKETSSILNEDQKKSLPDISKQKIEVAFILNKEKKFNESINVLLSINKRTDKDNLLLSINYVALKKPQIALSILNKIKPEVGLENILLGVIYMLINEHKRAVDTLEKYKGDVNGRISYLIGNCYLNLNEQDLAQKQFMRSVELKFSDAYEPLINILVKKGDLITAEKYSTEASNNGQFKASKSLLEKYALEKESDRLKFAENLIDLGIKSDETDPEFHLYKAEILYFDNKIDEAYLYNLKAHSYFLKRKSYNINYFANLLLLLNIVIDIKADKKLSNHLIDNITKKSDSSLILLYTSFNAIWNNSYQKGTNLFFKFMDKYSLNVPEVCIRAINNIFILLMSKKQYHSLLNIFNYKNFELGAQFKPTYYALMYHLQDEYPNEYLKMGDELKQPVDDIFERIEEMKIKYA